MPTVTIGDHLVDLDQLTPRAAAIARIWSANPLHTPGPIILESVRTMRDMGGDPDEAKLWGWDLDNPHRFVLDVPSTLPGGVGQPIEARLEALARALPIGYIPVGSSTVADVRLLVDEAAIVEDADLLTRTQVAQLLREQGRPISVRAIANYKSKPPAGWPAPAKYVGRTPLWSRTAVEAYADAAG